ncbi:MAG: hypothetical protein K6L73_06850 [Cellvibrionaceae bacterium]
MLQGLNAGHDHQDNILQNAIPSLQDPRRFVIELPGCAAVMELRPCGNYYLIKVGEVSLQEHARNSTGLYQAQKSPTAWDVANEERVDLAQGRSLVIGDRHKSAKTTAKFGVKALEATNAFNRFQDTGFYLHHSYGEKSATGYIRRKSVINPLSIKEVRDSSRKLANTMLQVRAESQKVENPDNRKNFGWISESGGSAVLTQALYRLKRSGISFHGHNHHMYFHEIASNADLAVKLALDLGFKLPDKPFSKPLWKATSLAVGGGHSAINYRYKAEKDYLGGMVVRDHIVNASGPALGFLGAASLIGGKAIAGIALLTAARKVGAAVKLTDSVLTDAMPERYETVQRKLGLKK